jgi:hypothetical protein
MLAGSLIAGGEGEIAIITAEGNAVRNLKPRVSIAGVQYSY